MKATITKEIALGKGVTAAVTAGVLTVKGPKGEVQRKFVFPKVALKVEPEKITLSAANGTKREKKIIGSFTSHIRNMVKGVQENYVYKLKICSGHFPMSVSVLGTEVVVKNFLGEAVPRKVSILPGATVKVDGTEITVTSTNKEIAGQTAARIENLCRITNRDRRIFQDGCYITQKAGKSIV